VDLTFPGLSAFDTLTGQGPKANLWGFAADNIPGGGAEKLTLLFTTTMTPGSLGAAAVEETGQA
jgi:hypothetical protein